MHVKHVERWKSNTLPKPKDEEIKMLLIYCYHGSRPYELHDVLFSFSLGFGLSI